MHSELVLERQDTMKVFGRPLGRYFKSILRVPQYLWWFAKCCVLFESPIRVVWCYVRRSLPSGRLLKLRTGLQIALSDHPHDAVTAFLVFVKEDYGKIPPNGTVVDIGANIGVFALYAARNKAEKVHAYEPSSRAYECLVRNISLNNLEKVIIPHRLAVCPTDGEQVKFPVRSSPYNTVVAAKALNECEMVDTVTLDSVVADTVDLLKMDCEGAEYEILCAANEEVFERIRAIRMEYHSGPEGILSAVGKHGFQVQSHKASSRQSGEMWLEKI